MRMTSPTELILVPALDAAWADGLLQPDRVVGEDVFREPEWLAADDDPEDVDEDEDEDDDEDDDADDDADADDDEDDDEDEDEDDEDEKVDEV